MFGFPGPSETSLPHNLGPLERQVMEVLWSRGESNVNDVLAALAQQRRAYTTVMTTLDRLYKKGLLDRVKSDRAFVYSPRCTQAEFEQHRAGHLVVNYLTSAPESNQALVSYLVDAVGRHDEALLDELEKKIRERRRDLTRGRKP